MLTSHCIELLANDLIERHDLAVPINPFKLAKILGVTSFRSIEMNESGRLVRSRTETLIYLKRGQPGERRRFTTAHEIGHLILEPNTQVAYRDSPMFVDENQYLRECLCDRFAAALLMPEREVRKKAGSNVNLADVLRIAKEFEVSVAAFVIRLKELRIAPLAMARYEESPEGPIIRSTICLGEPGDTYHLVTDLPTEFGNVMTITGQKGIEVLHGEIEVNKETRRGLFLGRRPNF